MNVIKWTLNVTRMIPENRIGTVLSNYESHYSVSFLRVPFRNPLRRQKLGQRSLSIYVCKSESIKRKVHSLTEDYEPVLKHFVKPVFKLLVVNR